jgi:hypothetical protein
MLDIPDGDAVIMMTDKALFLLDGTVNKQNYRYWAQENSQQSHQKPIHSSKVTVWCGYTDFSAILKCSTLSCFGNYAGVTSTCSKFGSNKTVPLYPWREHQCRWFETSFSNM